MIGRIFKLLFVIAAVIFIPQLIGHFFVEIIFSGKHHFGYEYWLTGATFLGIFLLAAGAIIGILFILIRYIKYGEL
jgi:hypothetical protein